MALVFAWTASADVSMTDRRMLRRQMRVEQARHKAEKAGRRANADTVYSTGSQSLIDGSGLEWFLNTDITFSTTSSASGAMSEASYTTSVTATYVSTFSTTITTTSGTTFTTITTSGTTLTILSDAFDGYNTLCVSTTGATGPCSTGDPDYTIYNFNGAPTVNGQQVDFPVQTIGTLDVSRKVYVPSGDSFARWLNIVTNNDTIAQQVTLITSNNLGSDGSTVVTTTSDGDAVAELTDQWAVTGQGNPVNGNCCHFDPPLGHILRGPGAAVGLASIFIVDGPSGGNNPYWSYTFTLDPGETGIIMNFATGQPSKAQAAAKAAEIAALPAAALQFMSATEKGQVLNFNVPTGMAAAPHDFNGDGNADILWHNQANGGLYTWFLGGTNGIVTQSGSYLTPSTFADTNWQIRGIADFNGDGNLDILWHHQVNGSLYVWFLGGTNGVVTQNGSYLTPSAFSNTQWQIRGVADFNGDGNPDILWHNQVTGGLYVWFLGGTNGVVTQNGAYLTPATFADTNWQIRGIADFNGDGNNDILWHHQGNGALYVWFLGGTNGIVTQNGSYLTPASFADTNWKIVEVADFNGDGNVDLLWHHQVTGALYAWFLGGTNGVVTQNGSYLTPSAFSDTNWKVVPR